MLLHILAIKKGQVFTLNVINPAPFSFYIIMCVYKTASCLTIFIVLLEASNLLVKSNLSRSTSIIYQLIHQISIYQIIKYTQYFLFVEAQKLSRTTKKIATFCYFSTTCCNKTLLHFSYRTLYVIVLLLVMISKAIQTILQKVAEIQN